MRYKVLTGILDRAYRQCAEGKGEARHGDEKTPWEAQEGAITIGRRFRGFCLGQAVKKCYESTRLPRDAAVEELLGAIVYIAAEIHIIETEGVTITQTRVARLEAVCNIRGDALEEVRKNVRDGGLAAFIIDKAMEEKP